MVRSLDFDPMRRRSGHKSKFDVSLITASQSIPWFNWHRWPKGSSKIRVATFWPGDCPPYIALKNYLWKCVEWKASFSTAKVWRNFGDSPAIPNFAYPNRIKKPAIRLPYFARFSLMKFTMKSPLNPIKSPVNHHFPMVFPWFSHGFPMVFPWFSNRRAAGPPMAMARSAEGANAPTARPRLDEATFRILWFKAMEKMVIFNHSKW